MEGVGCGAGGNLSHCAAPLHITTLTLTPSQCFSKCCDLGFHASLARTFRTYLSAQYNLETSVPRGLDVIENHQWTTSFPDDKHTVLGHVTRSSVPAQVRVSAPHGGRGRLQGAPAGALQSLCRELPEYWGRRMSAQRPGVKFLARRLPQQRSLPQAPNLGASSPLPAELQNLSLPHKTPHICV